MGLGGVVRLDTALAAVLLSAFVLGVPACSFEGTTISESELDSFPGPAPLCGTICDSQRGCEPCPYEGVEWCVNGTVSRCAQGGRCREVLETCSDPEACAGAICAKSADDCDAIAAAYENSITPSQTGSIVARVRPGDDGLAPGEYGPGCRADCDIVPGDCEAGLNTCWLVGYRTPDMDRLAALYQRMGCPPLSECDCPPLDSTVTCELVQTSDPNLPFNACVVR